MTLEQKQTYWLQHFKDWEQSKLSQQNYCKEHHVNFATFGYWRTKLCRKVNMKAQSKLIPITLQKSPLWLKVFLPSGIRLEVPVNALADILPILHKSVPGELHASS